MKSFYSILLLTFLISSPKVFAQGYLEGDDKDACLRLEGEAYNLCLHTHAVDRIQKMLASIRESEASEKSKTDLDVQYSEFLADAVKDLAAISPKPTADNSTKAKILARARADARKSSQHSSSEPSNCPHSSDVALHTCPDGTRYRRETVGSTVTSMHKIMNLAPNSAAGSSTSGEAKTTLKAAAPVNPDPSSP